jgi:hypothetical protein
VRGHPQQQQRSRTRQQQADHQQPAERPCACQAERRPGRAADQGTQLEQQDRSVAAQSAAQRLGGDRAWRCAERKVQGEGGDEQRVQLGHARPRLSRALPSRAVSTEAFLSGTQSVAAVVAVAIGQHAEETQGGDDDQ